MSSEPIDPGVIELAGRVFDLARNGSTARAAAVFRQSEQAVTALLAAGADADAGRPSARATAVFFELPAMVALLGAGA